MSSQENSFPVMKSVFSGFALDPEKCKNLSLDDKRKLVRETAETSKDAPELLRCFTRRELLRIICCEMGKERKYTGYSKSQMIQHLLKLISRPEETRVQERKRQRNEEEEEEEEEKEEDKAPTQVVDPEEKIAKRVRVCENAACRASLRLEDPFCKRCSCCVCHRYDDNKDPSLWLTCESDAADEDGSCGMSCHLECAMKHERSGILKREVDGTFCCVSCGKVNDIMRIWKKQLVIAKEARRVDVLCLRLSLCHKILLGTEKYKKVQDMVESAVKMLNKEVGPLDHVCSKMSRGIVNRLFCGAEVQKICSSAVELFDSVSSYPVPNGSFGTKEPKMSICEIKFEELSSTSVTVVLRYEDHLLNGELGCRLWHRKCSAEDYPEKPSFIVFKPEKRFEITNLEPSTAYFCKASLIAGRGVLGVWEAKWVTPGSAGAPARGESAVAAESTSSSDIIVKPAPKEEDVPAEPRAPRGKGSGLSPSSVTVAGTVSPSTPCKSDRAARTIAPSPGCEKVSEESDYEYSVRVVKWLEDKGHVNGDFRVKFLTWFSLKATEQERRVVSIFVEAFVGDPASLAGQLRHTFLDVICCDQKPVSRLGSCKVCGGVGTENALSYLIRK